MKPVQQLFSLVLDKIWIMQNKRVKIKSFKKEVDLLKKNTAEDKFEEKLEILKNKEIKILLFDEYLRETNNAKEGIQGIKTFFK